MSKAMMKSVCLVIGEVAQAHDGSLGTAHAFIDAIADAGADAVKFQTHIADAESTLDEPWRVRFGYQDETRYDYWKRMEFSPTQWRGLKEHADERDLLFLSSPFSIEALDLLSDLGIRAWKVASGEVTNVQLLNRMIESGLPILLSSGMSSMRELDAVVAEIQRAGNDLTLFQCTSQYPTPPEALGLNMLSEFRTRYGCRVGLSDHSGTIFAGLAAATLGADALEVHVTLSREAFGPDVRASVTTDDLRLLVNGVRFTKRALGHPVDKDAVARDLEPMRELFFKSVALRATLEKGTVLSEEHLTVKKPGTGIPASAIKKVVGRTLRRTVRQNTILTIDDLA